MANTKTDTDAKTETAPAVTSPQAEQKTETSESKLPTASPEPMTVEKNEKEKKAQAAKKGGKGHQMLVKPSKGKSKVPTETKPSASSGTKVNDEAKEKKAKEAKVKKQVAVEPVVLPVAAETPSVSKKEISEQASDKATKMKRLTLDIAKPLHKAIKAKAVEEGVPMVDMLRSLLEEHYSK